MCTYVYMYSFRHESLLSLSTSRSWNTMNQWTTTWEAMESMSSHHFPAGWMSYDSYDVTPLHLGFDRDHPIPISKGDLAFNWKCKELWWSADLYNFLSFFLYNCRSRCCCVAKYVSFWTLKIYRLSNQSSISLLLRFVKLRCQYVLLLVHMFT